MAYGESNGYVTDDVMLLTRPQIPIHLVRNISKTAVVWRCYLVLSNNCSLLQIVSCEAVQSAILATAWLLVRFWRLEITHIM